MTGDFAYFHLAFFGLGTDLPDSDYGHSTSIHRVTEIRNNGPNMQYEFGNTWETIQWDYRFYDGAAGGLLRTIRMYESTFYERWSIENVVYFRQ